VKYLLALGLSLVPLLLLTGAERPADSFKLDDGDRVVLLGSTLIEREQRYGWWEYALTTSFPGKKVIFRNLGWSGDTVFGDARAGFGSRADGFKDLKDHTLALKPTVILIGFGTNESFEGPAGLAEFIKGLNTLLDTLASSKAKIVLLSPLCQGDMGRPLPDPAANNKNLRLYSDAIREVAKKRGHRFVDLYDLLGDIGKVKPAVTDNGIHLTDRGYRWSARKLEKALRVDAKDWRVSFDPDPRGGFWFDVYGAGVTRSSKEQLVIQDKRLPFGPRILKIGSLGSRGLPAGKHTLFIDKKAIVTADSRNWAKGVKMDRGPQFDQAEKLRKLIVAKNELYFHRWRPQNVTYLFGFRKGEQGKNAPEIARFDPLIESKEKEIAALSVPVPHTYELKPAK
jgi:lysophospholipase L1-like esterase